MTEIVVYAAARLHSHPTPRTDRSVSCALLLSIARTLSVLLALGLPAAAQTAPRAAPLSAAERASLRAADRADLHDLRAATFARARGLDASERALLREAARRHPELAHLRAGENFDLSPHDIMVILSALTFAATLLYWVL